VVLELSGVALCRRLCILCWQGSRCHESCCLAWVGCECVCVCVCVCVFELRPIVSDAVHPLLAGRSPPDILLSSPGVL